MHEKLYRQIVFEAARLMYTRQETDARKARLLAARRFRHGYIPNSELPSSREIHDQVQRLTNGEPLEYPLLPTEPTDSEITASDGERFAFYRTLLIALECVKQSRKRHPEGDALYHSLQVFELARDEDSYDEDFLLAALLHDVGKAIDPLDHIGAGLAALHGMISERTEWFIEQHILARGLLDGSIGVRARRRLAESADFELLETLARCDRDGCVPGARVCDLDEALEYIRSLDDL